MRKSIPTAALILLTLAACRLWAAKSTDRFADEVQVLRIPASRDVDRKSLLERIERINELMRTAGVYNRKLQEQAEAAVKEIRESPEPTPP